nr:MAG TPA: hypothetical protein [Caudoviricetes sp.]
MLVFEGLHVMKNLLTFAKKIMRMSRVAARHNEDIFKALFE